MPLRRYARFLGRLLCPNERQNTECLCMRCANVGDFRRSIYIHIQSRTWRVQEPRIEHRELHRREPTAIESASLPRCCWHREHKFVFPRISDFAYFLLRPSVRPFNVLAFYSRILVEELTCLATWKDGNSRYLVGLVSHHHAVSNEERYRCFVYERILSSMFRFQCFLHFALRLCAAASLVADA